MTLRIVADVREDGTTIRLIGRMRAEHVEHVRAEIAAGRAPAALDLDEVTWPTSMRFASSSLPSGKASFSITVRRSSASG